jgi:hypothetical protein
MRSRWISETRATRVGSRGVRPAPLLVLATSPKVGSHVRHFRHEGLRHFHLGTGTCPAGGAPRLTDRYLRPRWSTSNGLVHCTACVTRGSQGVNILCSTNQMTRRSSAIGRWDGPRLVPVLSNRMVHIAHPPDKSGPYARTRTPIAGSWQISGDRYNPVCGVRTCQARPNAGTCPLHA